MAGVLKEVLATPEPADAIGHRPLRPAATPRRVDAQALAQLHLQQVGQADHADQPLDLNLLGLRVQLSRVLLNITGETGPGNLLGNLLCGIAGLLNPPGPLAQLLDLLNNLLRSV